MAGYLENISVYGDSPQTVTWSYGVKPNANAEDEFWHHFGDFVLNKFDLPQIPQGKFTFDELDTIWLNFASLLVT